MQNEKADQENLLMALAPEQITQSKLAFDIALANLIAEAARAGVSIWDLIGSMCDLIGLILKSKDSHERKRILTDIRWRILKPQIKLTENSGQKTEIPNSPEPVSDSDSQVSPP